MQCELGVHYPRAEHAGRVRLGSIELHSYVLDDGRRVFTQQGMLHALGITFGGSGQKGGYRLGNFIAQKAFVERAPAMPPLISAELRRSIYERLLFVTPKRHLAYGYEVTLLPDLVAAILRAKIRGLLTDKVHDHIVARAEVLLQGFARVGIIALVDEATGYQSSREVDALQGTCDGSFPTAACHGRRCFPTTITVRCSASGAGPIGKVPRAHAMPAC